MFAYKTYTSCDMNKHCLKPDNNRKPDTRGIHFLKNNLHTINLQYLKLDYYLFKSKYNMDIIMQYVAGADTSNGMETVGNIF